jgi:hypothetical protein
MNIKIKSIEIDVVDTSTIASSSFVYNGCIIKYSIIHHEFSILDGQIRMTTLSLSPSEIIEEIKFRAKEIIKDLR